MNRSEKGNHGLWMGKAAEHAVASQLLLREVNVSWPSLDEGWDLLASNGCRIQVKSSHIDGQTRKGKSYYWFPFSKVKYVVVSNTRARVKTVPKLSERCDVVVCWGVEENRFWVLPAELCDRSHALVLGYHNERRFSGSIETLREMAKLGYTHQEIANELNIDRTQVTNHINDLSRSRIEPSVMSLARACEGAWETILNFGEPAVVSQVETSEVKEQ